MPNIRIVNWNIEKLSANKTAIATMANAIGRIIVTLNADIVIITEVAAGSWQAAMTAVSNAANGVAAGANDYRGWLTSYSTGGEVYGVLIKNLNLVRPMVVAGGPGGAGTLASPALGNLDQNQFSTWPGTYAAMANAYAAALPGAGARQLLPLTNLYARSQFGRHRDMNFAGQPLAGGAGYALGNGFRMPCLMMFNIATAAAAAANHLVPIVVCHHGAVRGGANYLARGQIGQYKDTHIAQKFGNGPALPNGSHIVLDNAAVRVQELIVTGDFNVDFLDQSPPAAANRLTLLNRAAFNTLTPTTTNGGSAGPAAAPGGAGPVPGAVPIAAPLAGWPAAPLTTANPILALRASTTSVGTILNRYNALVVPANTLALRGACFDNFFFGGTQLSATVQALAAGPHAGAVGDVPFAMVQNAFLAPGLDVSAIWAHHNARRVAWLAAGSPPPPRLFRNCAAAPNLAPGAAVAALTTNDRLIGARFISDHLPTVVQFNLP